MKEHNEALCSGYECGQTMQESTLHEQCRIATETEDTKLVRVQKDPSVLCRTERMPTVPGYLEGQPVTILRDPGYDTAISKHVLVPSEKLLGKTGIVY